MNNISHSLPIGSNSFSSFKSFSKGISLFVIVVGCLVLVGWALDIIVLKSIVPGLATMKSNTALLFVLSATSLWMQCKDQARRIAQACAFIVALAGLLTLAEYLLKIDLGIDQILFRETAANVLYPGRMSPATALAFLLLGLALIFLDNLPRNWFNELLAVLVFAISVLALIGYIYGVSSLYQIGAYSSMAVHTAVNFVLLSMGVIFARPERGLMQTILADTLGGNILRRFLPVAIVLPVVLGWIRLLGQQAGLYDTAFGLAIMVTSIIITLTIFIWLNSGQLTDIDIKRKQMDASLRASEMRFRSTLENMMEGCQILGYDWRYLYINPSAEKHNRRPNSELLGNIYMDMWPGIEATAVFTALRSCMNERRFLHLENEFTFPDGSKGWFELSIQPVPDGIFMLSSDITTHKRAEQELIEREMKLSTLFEILPVGISILDAESKVSYTNRAWKEMLELSEEELLKGNYTNRTYLRADGTLMPVDELARTRAFKEKREIDNIETGIVKEDNSIVWTNASAVPVDYPDWKVVMVASDITERKQAEERFRLAIESAPNAIIMVDQHGQIVLVNSQTEKYFGYDREELIAANMDQLVPARFRNKHADHRLGFFSQLQARPMGVGRDLFGLRKDGVEFPVEIGLAPITTQQGMLVIATIVDITERKLAEGEILKLNAELEEKVAERTASLAQANALLQTMMDHVPDHIYFKDLQSRFIRNSRSQIKTLGLDEPAQAIGKTDFDFFPHAQRSYDEEQEIIKSGQPLIDFEESVAWPDGRKTWLSTTKLPLRDQHGQIIGTFGISRDITDRKYAEVALQKANEQLRQLSLFDELTGLYNRRGFLLLAEEQLLLARRAKHNLLVYYADLDGLKQINDHFGHSAGDEAIVKAARILDKSFRASDIKARLGGDEFIVLALEANERSAHIMLARLRESLARNDQSMSVGVVTFDAQNDMSMEELITSADKAMYTEKRKKSDSR